MDSTTVEREVRDIRRDLEYLREKVKNHKGDSKEVDHALDRIARIEKHLGMNHKVAS
jgi:hypothetical protein